MFIGVYPNDSSKGVISKLYKEVMKKKFQTTEYVKQKWETEGNLLILHENCLDMLNFRRKCTNSSMARIWLEVLHLFAESINCGRGLKLLEAVRISGSQPLARFLGMLSAKTLLVRVS